MPKAEKKHLRHPFSLEIPAWRRVAAPSVTPACRSGRRNRPFKRWLSLALCFCVILCACAAQVTTAQAATESGIPVLMYHQLRDSNEMNEEQKKNLYIVSTEAFREQMRYLRDNNYHTITPEELLDYLYNGKDLPPRSVFIQFDDGYYCNIVRGYPVLKEYGQKATIFSITFHASDPQLPYSPGTAAFIAQETMRGTGDVITYASHTHNLHQWGQFLIAPKENALADLNSSFAVVDTPIIFAYPNGLYNQERTEALQEAGVRLAFIGEAGYVTRQDDPYRLKRFGIFNYTTFDDFTAYVRGDETFPPSQNAGYTEAQEIIRSPAAWAADDLQKAAALGLFPSFLDNQYKKALTRAEFCAIAVAFYETLTGGTITGRMAFSDTADENVQKMGALGVVSGQGDGSFLPNDNLTREQAAVMLARLAAVSGKPLPQGSASFFDERDIAPWALDAIGRVSAAEIMGGTGDNMFSPKQLYTVEQGVITILRLYESIN